MQKYIKYSGFCSPLTLIILLSFCTLVNMLYYLLRILFRIANAFFFRTLQVKGAENIPDDGPLFFVANHPSAFMDPIVIATLTKRRLFFIAKGAVFQTKFSKWLLPKFNIIPIYRTDETPGQGHKNKDVFRQCYKHLANNGCILIFPEGLSLTERKIKKIQSGTARICFGAEAENNFKLHIKIVAVGLNFSDPHKFQSDLFVNIDKPILVSDYYEQYKQDSFKAAHALTDEIRRRIEAQVVAIQDADVDKLVANIELIYKAQLLKDFGHDPGKLEGDFKTTRAISESVHYFLEHDPARVNRTKDQINDYLDNLERLKLNDGLIKGVGKKAPIFEAILSVIYLIIGFPLFLFGFINNYLPFRIPFWIAKPISKRPEFFGSIALTVGTFAFLIFYSVQIWLVHKFFHNTMLSLGYAVLLPISGFFAYYYHKRFTNIRGSWMIFSMFYKKTNLITSLINKRQMIIEELEKGKKEFLAATSSGS
jgi:glycerol-3-phosphate O-acyltransferase/dihydroxyacetone phosphate acyltransferase